MISSDGQGVRGSGERLHDVLLGHRPLLQTLVVGLDHGSFGRFPSSAHQRYTFTPTTMSAIVKFFPARRPFLQALLEPVTVSRATNGRLHPRCGPLFDACASTR